MTSITSQPARASGNFLIGGDLPVVRFRDTAPCRYQVQAFPEHRLVPLSRRATASSDLRSVGDGGRRARTVEVTRTR